MTGRDIKVRIHNIIDNIPDEGLKELLMILEDIERNSVDHNKVEIAKLIIAKNKTLLQKLAQ